MSHKNLVWWDGDLSFPNCNIYNWGDWLNPWLFSKISGTPIEDINRISLYDEEETPRYYMVGSILDFPCSSNYEVWGAGFGHYNGSVPKYTPTKIHSVRGPLTRKKLIQDSNQSVPEIYGDPALLLPRYYTPKVKKEYKYGIIQHFSHKNINGWVSKYRNNPNVNVIDIQNRSITGFIDEVNKCETILSSALHGIICGDAYGIPSYHINFDQDGKYNWFKFNDYYLSVGRPLTKPIHIDNDSIDINDMFPPLYNYFIDIDLEKLLDVCPFKS